jgi:phytol kinase
MFVLLTLVYWRESPIGIIALMMMCGGDGIADIFGRRIPSPKLPWSKEKSVAGMVSVFVGGWVMSAVILSIYVNAGVFAAPITNYLFPLTVISVVGAAVESLHYRDIDNISMTLASALVGHWFF